jgi:tetratricopeptide (TPR) repeat protein
MTKFLKVAAFLVGALGAAVYIGRAVRMYAAARAADGYELEGLVRAARLSPGNAEYFHLLGLQFSFSSQTSREAVENLQRAIRLNPNSGRYWLDLGSVYQIRGERREEEEALDAAIRTEPGNAELAAEAAQYYLIAGNTARALPLVRRALEQYPEGAPSLLSVCWQTTHDTRLMLDQAVPDAPEQQGKFLEVLTQREEYAATRQVWQRLVDARHGVPLLPALHYFEYLLAKHHAADLLPMWQEFAGASPAMQAYTPGDNAIVNSGFEQPLLDAGFDWRRLPADHVYGHVDGAVAHSGAHSLALLYDGQPVGDSGWQQLVPVREGTDYDFSAWVKSEELLSSSGPRIFLVDAYTSAVVFASDDVLDTHPWHQLGGKVHVPAGTQVVWLKIARAPANTRIRGKVWFDDLELKPASGSLPQAVAGQGPARGAP